MESLFMNRDSFWGEENVLKLDYGVGLHNFVNILITTELYTLKERS